jgi:hypothetical protein
MNSKILLKTKIKTIIFERRKIFNYGCKINTNNPFIAGAMVLLSFLRSVNLGTGKLTGRSKIKKKLIY